MNTFAPFGLKKTRGTDSCPSDAMNRYTIASGYATTIGFDDLVKSDGVGGVQKATAGNTPLGTFKGCRYTATDGSYRFSKTWPASTVLMSGTKCYCDIDDSPMAVFEAQTKASILFADIGAFVDLIDAAPDSALGQSRQFLSPAAAYGPVTSFSGITGGSGYSVGNVVTLTPAVGDTLGVVTTTTVATVSSGAITAITTPAATALFMLAPTVSFATGTGAAATAVLTTVSPSQFKIERILEKAAREVDANNNTIGFTSTTEGQYALCEVKYAKHERGGTSLAVAT